MWMICSCRLSVCLQKIEKLLFLWISNVFELEAGWIRFNTRKKLVSGCYWYDLFPRIGPLSVYIWGPEHYCDYSRSDKTHLGSHRQAKYYLRPWWEVRWVQHYFTSFPESKLHVRIWQLTGSWTTVIFLCSCCITQWVKTWSDLLMVICEDWINGKNQKYMVFKCIN